MSFPTYTYYHAEVIIGFLFGYQLCQLPYLTLLIHLAYLNGYVFVTLPCPHSVGFFQGLKKIITVWIVHEL